MMKMATISLQTALPLPKCPKLVVILTGHHTMIEFNIELADFLYRRNQMSGGDIDFILSLWEATLISQNNHSPFRNHEDLHVKIDATTLGNHPWQKITI